MPIGYEEMVLWSSATTHLGRWRKVRTQPHVMWSAGGPYNHDIIHSRPVFDKCAEPGPFETISLYLTGVELRWMLIRAGR
jgi:hypothetical protein